MEGTSGPQQADGSGQGADAGKRHMTGLPFLLPATSFLAPERKGAGHNCSARSSKGHSSSITPLLISIMRTFRFLPLLFLLTFPAARAQFEVHDFSATQDVRFFGNAAVDGTGGVLIPAGMMKLGAIWSQNRQEVAEAFTTTFRFRITEPGSFSEPKNESGGGDGFAFVIQNTAPDYLHGLGHQLGYDSLPNSLAIEFDTWYNRGIDTNSMHVSVQSRGREPNSVEMRYSLGMNSQIPNLEDSAEHTVRITYGKRHLRLWIDGAKTPCVEVEVDLAKLLELNKGRAWVGFTGASAVATERIELSDWTFAND